MQTTTVRARGIEGAGRVHGGGDGQPGRRRRVALALAVLGMVLLAAPAWAGAIGDYRCTDPGRVYHGNPRLIRDPAVISADRVYERIPEYRQILDEGLTDRDVRYHFLMKKASERFAKAVKQMARAEGHDFVAEVGAVEVAKEGVSEAPDRTDNVIDALG